MDYPVSVYYNYLGELLGHQRSIWTESGREAESLYYQQANHKLCFYDKSKQYLRKERPLRTFQQRIEQEVDEIEQAGGSIVLGLDRPKSKPPKHLVPEPYRGKHVLRYEQRYTGRLPETFGKKGGITADMLYSKSFWNIMVKRWYKKYFAIRKVNDITLNFNSVKGLRGLDTLGRLALVERAGGEVATINLINESRRRGTISKDTAKSLRSAIRSVCDGTVGRTTVNDCILELDRKVEEAYEMFRDGGSNSIGTEQGNLLTIKN